MRAELLSRLIGDAIQFRVANDGRGAIDPDINNSGFDTNRSIQADNRKNVTLKIVPGRHGDEDTRKMRVSPQT